MEFIPPVYDELFPFDGDFASARLRDKYGFINKATKAFKEKNFISIGPLSEGLAHAQTISEEGRCGYIDAQGNGQIPFNYVMCASFDEGLAPVIKEFKKGWGYIDCTGRLVIAFTYDQAFSFKNGIAKVVRKNKTFYIDRSGKEYKK